MEYPPSDSENDGLVRKNENELQTLISSIDLGSIARTAKERLAKPGETDSADDEILFDFNAEEN